MKAGSGILLAAIVGCALVLPALGAGSAKGSERVLYSFTGTDGEYPAPTLYGTTDSGGPDNSGAGTVFALDPKTGAETVLYAFCSQQNCTDGANSIAALIEVNGTLYGTTGYGGNANDGVAFALDPKIGTEKVLHSLCSQQNCADGKISNALLTYAKGALYGTTLFGGTADDGTVFALKKP